MIICGLQVKDYSGSGCGVPDLIVWNHKKRKAKFAEVKGPQDTLRETQKVQAVLVVGVPVAHPNFRLTALDSLDFELWWDSGGMPH